MHPSSRVSSRRLAGRARAAGRARESPVAERIHRALGVDDVDARLRQTREERVDSGRDEVRAETARDAGESSGYASQGMAASGVKDHAAQGNDQDVAGINRRVADDTDQDDHRRQ